jgi:hypothetical protein
MLLGPHEQKIAVFRKHWLVMFFEMILFGLVFLIPVVVIWLTLILSGVTLIPQLQAVLMVGAATWMLFVWVAFFIVYTDYYLDVWVLTNKRLIDVDQKGLFSREVAVARIEKIEDVTAEVSGILPTIFGYGDVFIQSAGAHREFTIRNIKNPKRVRDMILREQERKSQETQNVRIVQ